jgi:mono/diheme cytochrome c family protein
VAGTPLDSAGALAAAGIVTPADSAAGEVVYRGAGKCLSCHGAAGEGVAQLGPNLRDQQWIVGDGSLATIARAVREGIAPPKEFPIAMPAYASSLPDDAINRVAAYVYALSHVGGVQHDSLAPRPDSARVPAPNAPPPVPRPTVPAPEPPR